MIDRFELIKTHSSYSNREVKVDRSKLANPLLALAIGLVFIQPLLGSETSGLNNKASLAQTKNQLAKRISELEMQDDQKLLRIRKIYKEKCKIDYQISQKNCYLKISDLDPQYAGAEDRVLLFRGEPKIYPTSGLSKSLRSSTLCSDDCSLKKYVRILAKNLSKLMISKYDFLSDRYVFSEEQWWKVPSYFSLKVGFSKSGLTAMTETPNADLQYYSTTELMAADHMASPMFYHADQKNSSVIQAYDPLVSYSISPEVAYSFSTFDTNENATGRVIMLAVPESKIVWNFPCDKSLIQSFSFDRLYDIASCNVGHQDYIEELEVNAILVTQPNYIRSVFVVKRPWIHHL